MYKGLRFRVQEVAVKRPAPALRTAEALARLQEEVQVVRRSRLSIWGVRTSTIVVQWGSSQDMPRVKIRVSLGGEYLYVAS